MLKEQKIIEDSSKTELEILNKKYDMKEIMMLQLIWDPKANKLVANFTKDYFEISNRLSNEASRFIDNVKDKVKDHLKS